MSKIKERSPYHFHKMSDEVRKELSKKSKESGLSQWLIAEKILEGALLKSKVDVKKWLKTI